MRSRKITVPAASATSPLAVGNDGKIAVYAELAIGNETIAREPALGAPATLTIPRSGEYTLRYVAIDGAGAEHTLDRAAFTAIDRPVILEADEETVQVGYPYEIEKKLCYYLGGEYPTGYAVFDGTTGERVSVTDGAFAPTARERISSVTSRPWTAFRPNACSDSTPSQAAGICSTAKNSP